MKRKVAEWLTAIFGMRKFLAWFGIFAVGIVFRLKNQIDGGQFVDLLKATFAGFVTGNLAEHAVNFGKDYLASKAPANDTSPVKPAPVAPEDEEVTPVIEG